MTQPMSADVERLLEDLQSKEATVRKIAAESLGKLTTSNERIVRALIATRESDFGFNVRNAATESLLAPVHQSVIKQYPELASLIAPKKNPRIGRNQRIIIIIATCVVVAIGLWLLVILTLTRPEIKTSEGTLVITKVHFADRVPPGCTSSSPTCLVAESGYRILIIWMGPKSGGNIQTLSDVIPKGVYVVADDGSRTEWFNKITNASPPFITLAFAVKNSESNFKVVWSNNPDIDLNPLLYFIP